MASRIYKIAFKLNAMLGSKYMKTFEQAESKAERLSATLDAVGKRATLAITAPLKAIGAASVLVAKDWESSWVGVRKVTKASEEDLQELENTARRMARELPHTHDAVAAVFEAGSRLGVVTEHLEGFSRTMLAVESTTTLTLDSAANSFATIAGIMGTSHADFDRMGSTILYLGSNFATTESAILGMSENMAGAAALAGLSESQVMGFSTAISSLGMSSSAGASTFSTFISDMNRSVAIGDESLTQFAEIAGKTAYEFSEAFREDAASAVLSFISGLTHIDEEGGNVLVTLDELGLTGIYMEQMLTGLVSSYDTLTNALDSSNTAWEENEFLTYAVAERYATMESRIQVVKNQIRDTGITIGKILMPYVEKLVDGAGKLIARFSNLDEKTQGNIIVMGKLAAAAGPVMLVTGKMVSAIVKLKGVYTTVTTAMKAKAVATGLVTNVEKAKIAATKASVIAENLTTKAEKARLAVISSTNAAKKLAIQAENAKALRTTGSAKAEILAMKAEKARLAVIKNKIIAKNLNTKAESARAIATKYSVKVETASAAITTKSSVAILAKSGAIKVATVAQKAWNLAMSMNPIGIVVGGVALLTAGVMGLAKWIGSAGKEYRNLYNESDNWLKRQIELTDSATQQSLQFEENTRNMQIHGKYLREVADKVSYLSEKQDLSAGEMAKLDHYMTELNDNVPDLALSFDNYTGSLNMTTEALHSYLSASEAQANLKVQLEERLRLQEEYLSLEKALAETSEQRLYLYEQLNNGTRRNRKEREYLENTIENLTEAEILLSDAMSDNYAMQQYLTNSIEDNARAVENFEKAQREAAYSIDGLNNSMRHQAFTFEEWETAQKEALDKMTSTFENYKRVAGNAFSTVSENAAISISELTSNLIQNATAVEDWSKNMAILTERGLDDGLLEQLRQAGPEAAATVRELVNSTYYELEALNEAYERSAQVAVESMARELDPMGVAGSAEELIDHVALVILENESMENALIDKVNTSFNIFSDTIDYVGFDSAGYNIALGIANGIENGTGIVVDATIALANRILATTKRELDINSPSRKTMEIGKFLMEGLNQGIHSKENEVLESCKYIADCITSNLHVTAPCVEFTHYKPDLDTSISRFNIANNMEDNAFIAANPSEYVHTLNLSVIEEASMNSYLKTGLEIGTSFIDDLNTGMYSKIGELKDTCKNIVNYITDNLHVTTPSIELPNYISKMHTSPISFNRAKNIEHDVSVTPDAFESVHLVPLSTIEDATATLPFTNAVEVGTSFIDNLNIGMYSKIGELKDTCKNIVNYITDNLHVTAPNVEFSNYTPEVADYLTHFEDLSFIIEESKAFSILRGFNKFKNLSEDDNEHNFDTRPIDYVEKINQTPTYNSSDIVVKYNPQISIEGNGQNSSELENMIKALLQEGYADIKLLVNQVLDERKTRELRLSNG